MESISPCQTRIKETIQTTHLALVDENNLSTYEKLQSTGRMIVKERSRKEAF